MKTRSLLVICMILFVGTCAVSASPVPNLSGRWVASNGTVILFTGETQTISPSGDAWNLSQQDRIIIGTNTFPLGDEKRVENLTGVIVQQNHRRGIVS